MHEVGCVFLSHSQCFSIHPCLLIHIYRLFRLFGLDEGRLSFCKISSLEVEFGLVEENFVYAFRMVLSSDLEGGVPVLFVLVHIYSLLWFICLDELLLSFFKSILVLQFQSVLQMHLR